jgi:hypothetical protein
MKFVQSLLLIQSVYSSACLVTDIEDQAYLFGTPEGDFGIVGNSELQKLENSVNRPNFEGTNTQCFLAQYNNALYAVDSSKQIFKYYFGNNTWATTTTTGDVDTSKMALVLDHDTLVFYGLYNQQMYFLTLTGGEETASWILMNQSPFPSSYVPVVGFSQNHLFFLSLPDQPPSTARVFVIHYSYWQPELQQYSGPKFPQTTGKTTFLLKSDNSVPFVFVFIPDDFSSTFLVDAEISKNSTVSFPSPTVKDTKAIYTAGFSKIYQLTSNYQIWSLDTSLASNGWIQTKSPVLDKLASSAITGIKDM